MAIIGQRKATPETDRPAPTESQAPSRSDHFGEALAIEPPAHLQDPPSEPYALYGTLEWDDDRAEWRIEGDPQAALMAKRLFPGAHGRGQGVARFPHTRRIAEDLNWFMLRFPLEVRAPDYWARAKAQAVEGAQRRVAVNQRPIQVRPEAHFRGELWDWQENGVAYLVANRRTLLADEQSLGKTVMAWATAAVIDTWPIAVVVQPHLIDQWIASFETFLGGQGPSDLPLFEDSGLRYHQIQGIKGYELPEAEVYFLHYGLLRHWAPQLAAPGIAGVFWDEIQELRRTGSQKYSAATRLSEAASEFSIGLSGTPIYNRGGEIWSVTNILERHCLGDWESFSREWCTGYGQDTLASPEALHAHLEREGLMLRRRKKDVYPDWLDKARYPQYVEGDEHTYNEIVAEGRRLARQAKEVTDPWEKGRLEQRAEHLDRQATGAAKAPAAAAFVASLIEADEPVVVFAHHHQVFDTIQTHLESAGFRVGAIHGQVTSKNKTRNKEAFIAGELDCLLIGLRVASGLDGLEKRASIAVFAELDWSPQIHGQCEDRLHRDPTSPVPVIAYYVISQLGADPIMQERLGVKVSQFVGIVGDQPETEEQRALANETARRHMERAMAKLRGDDPDAIDQQPSASG